MKSISVSPPAIRRKWRYKQATAKARNKTQYINYGSKFEMITAATAEGLVRRWQRSPAPSENNNGEGNISVRPISQLDAQRIIDASAQRLSAAEKHFKRFCTAAFQVKTAMAVAEARLSYSGRAASKGRQGSPSSSHGGVAGTMGRVGMSRAGSETASLYADSFYDYTSALGGTDAGSMHTHIPQPSSGGFTRGGSSSGLPPAAAPARNGSLSPRPAAGGRSISLVSSSASSSPRGATSGKVPTGEPAPRKPFYISSAKNPSPKMLSVVAAVEESPSSSPLGVRPSLRKHLLAKNGVPNGQHDSILINPAAALTQFVDVNAETVVRERPSSASSSLLRRQRAPQGPPSLASAVNVAVEARAAEKRVSEVIAHGRSIREGVAIETAVSQARRGSGGGPLKRNAKEGGVRAVTGSLLSTQKKALRPSSEREAGYLREPRVLSQITLSSATSAIDLSSDSD